MILCTATSNGSTTTFVDTLNLNHEVKLFQNRHGIFSGGTSANLERVVRVSDLVKTTQTITFTPALPSATAIADECELWNERDEGITPAAVHELINDAISDLLERSPLPVTSDAFDFAADSSVISIDDVEVDSVVDGDNWEVFIGADWQDDFDIWHPIDKADWRLDRYARTVEIMGNHRYLADGRSIRLRGANLPTALTSDSSTTSIDFEWITHHVAAQALGIRLEKAYDRKDVEGNLLRLQQRADAIRPKGIRYLPGAHKRLR